MAYLIDRHRALWSHEIVVMLSLHQRGIRSRVILRDNSLYQTLTRTQTFVRRTHACEALIVTSRWERRGNSQGALWWIRP